MALEVSTRRTVPRTTCDQCGHDWSGEPQNCVTVMIPRHPLYWQTICIDCVDTLGITGCAYRDGEPVESVWGTAAPPPGWKGQRSSAAELLRSVSSANYMLSPRPREFERIDVRKLAAELMRGDAA